MNSKQIAAKLQARPDLIDALDTVKINGYDISHVLRARPELADKLDLSKLSSVAETLVTLFKHARSLRASSTYQHKVLKFCAKRSIT